MAYPCSPSGDSPKPRASTEMTRCWAARTAIRPDQIPRANGNGCSNTTGDPAPCSSYPTARAPRLNIVWAKLPQSPERLQHERRRAGGARSELKGAPGQRLGRDRSCVVVVVQGAKHVAPGDGRPDLGLQHDR